MRCPNCGKLISDLHGKGNLCDDCTGDTEEYEETDS